VVVSKRGANTSLSAVNRCRSSWMISFFFRYHSLLSLKFKCILSSQPVESLEDYLTAHNVSTTISVELILQTRRPYQSWWYQNSLVIWKNVSCVFAHTEFSHRFFRAWIFHVFYLAPYKDYQKFCVGGPGFVDQLQIIWFHRECYSSLVSSPSGLIWAVWISRTLFCVAIVLKGQLLFDAELLLCSSLRVKRKSFKLLSFVRISCSVSSPSLTWGL